MPNKYRKTFRTGRVTAHVRHREGKGYEVRCQVDNRKISVNARTLEEAKEKFIKKLHTPEQPKQPERVQEPERVVIFDEYVMKWMESVKKPNVKKSTYEVYLINVVNDIIPAFKGRRMDSLQILELQEFVNGFIYDGKNRTAKKVAQLLSSVLEYAMHDGIINRNPMKLVRLARYEAKHGIPLSREEERKLIEEFEKKPTLYLQAYVFMLYTGLRRSEVASASVDGEWVNVLTAKQRKGLREKERSIPISPMLKKWMHLLDLEKIKAITADSLSRGIKKVLPNHHLHDLRHTFITRCQECGIQRELVSLWAGHAADSSITSTVYTHLEYNKEHQIDEINKYKYDL